MLPEACVIGCLCELESLAAVHQSSVTGVPVGQCHLIAGVASAVTGVQVCVPANLYHLP